MNRVQTVVGALEKHFQKWHPHVRRKGVENEPSEHETRKEDETQRERREADENQKEEVTINAASEGKV